MLEMMAVATQYEACRQYLPMGKAVDTRSGGTTTRWAKVVFGGAAFRATWRFVHQRLFELVSTGLGGRRPLRCAFSVRAATTAAPTQIAVSSPYIRSAGNVG